MTEDIIQTTNTETTKNISDDDDSFTKVDLSDRPNATRWMCQIKGNVITAVKIKRHEDDELFISEVAILAKSRHMPGKRLMLPNSYLPYIHNQWFAIIPDGETVFRLSPDLQLYFFSGIGAELRDDKSDIEVELPALKRCFINKSLEGMEPPFELARLTVEPETVAVEQPQKVKGKLFTGSPSAGKTTLVKLFNQAGHKSVDGDDFGKSIRKGRKAVYQNYYYWALSELRELGEGKTLFEVGDAILDLFGATSFAFASFPLEHQMAFWAEYVRSQEERDRPRHFFYDYIEEMLELDESDRIVAYDVLSDRYNDEDTVDAFVWDADWILDLDKIKSTIDSGVNVFVIGQNWRDLMDLAAKEEWEWYHLVVPIGTINRRLKERGEKWHKAGTFPSGIKDVPYYDVAVRDSTMIHYALSNGAELMHSDGRWKASDVF